MKAVSKRQIAEGLVCIGLFVVWVIKLRMGLHADEVYSVTLGTMLAQDTQLFKECWSSLQLSALIEVPFVRLYLLFHGRQDGIVLYFRMMSVLIQVLIAFFLYRSFKDYVQKSYAFLAAVLLALYTADFQSFTYKQQMIWFCMLQAVLTFRYLQTEKDRYIICLSIVIVCNVLAYPTTVLMLPLLLITVWYYKKQDRKLMIRFLFLLFGMLLLLTVLFWNFFLSELGWQEFWMYFQNVFMDSNLDTNFVDKLWHPIIKYLALAVIMIVPLLLTKRWKGIPTVTILLVVAFAMQAWIERRTITWHVINYPYVLTIFVICYLLCRKGEVVQRQISVVFSSIALMSALCATLASNQGNITSMYGGVLGAVGLVLLLGTKEMDVKIWKERKLIAGSLLAMAAVTAVLFVYEQETVDLTREGQCTIFTKRIAVEYGPAKGMFLGEDTYENYAHIYKAVSENVGKDDIFFIVGDTIKSPIGYLCADEEARYGAYSTYGMNYLAGELGKPESYWKENPDRTPTVIAVNTDFWDRIESLEEDNGLKEYILRNYGQKSEEEGYMIFGS